jgi:transposase
VNKITTFVGLDVHKKTISVAVAHEGVEPYSCGKMANRPERVAELVKKLGAKGTLYTYEAGPCGYALYRRLADLGARCLVAVPSRIPKVPGERVKTDRLDALKLARLLRSGDLRAVWVPSPEQEALRDLSRARQAAQKDLLRVRNRTTKLLLRLEVHPPEGVNHWTAAYGRWLAGLKLEQPHQQAVLEELLRALAEGEERVKRLTGLVKEAAKAHPEAALIRAYQALRGVGVITAMSLLAELGDITRFETPRRLMGYVGQTPTEDSSSERIRRGHITRAGNAHVRHVMGEMAWHAARPLPVGRKLQDARRGQSPAVLELAQRADERLNHRYHRLIRRGKLPVVAATAVAREALGFIWAIARTMAGLPVHPPRGALPRARAA